ncbi:MAG: hypothetical protein WDN24_06405 [Sphingomonas sp.]
MRSITRGAGFHCAPGGGGGGAPIRRGASGTRAVKASVRPSGDQERFSAMPGRLPISVSAPVAIQRTTIRGASSRIET